MDQKFSPKITGGTSPAGPILMRGINGNIIPWLESVRKAVGRTGDIHLTMALSFVHDNKKFQPPHPSKTQIIAQCMEAGDEMPSEEDVATFYSKALGEKLKLLRAVELRGTDAFQFLEDRISADSWAIIEAHADFEACYSKAVKDAFGLWKIIRATHALSGDGAFSLTSAESEVLEEQFNLFNQGDLSLSAYFKTFNQWIERRKMAKLPDLPKRTITEKFYAKLNKVKYEEVIRMRRNSQHIHLQAGTVQPEESLAAAYQFLESFQPAPRVVSKPLGVFVGAEKESAVAAEDSGLSDKVRDMVFVALKNFVGTGASAGGAAAASSVKAAGELLVNGRPWTRMCLNPGCGMMHPFWMHTSITGTPLAADLQLKVDQFNNKKSGKKAAASTVLTSTFRSDEDEDDDYEVSRYFVGISAAHPFDNAHMLFDNEAGTSMVKNMDLLQDVRKLKVPRIISGVAGEAGGELTAEYDGQFGQLGRIPFVPGAVANILAHADCRKWGYKVTLKDEEDKYTVHTPDGDMVFTLLPSSPRAHYACRVVLEPIEEAPNTVNLVTTIAGNLSQYSRAEVERAVKARKLLINLGMPSAARMISGLNGLSNREVTAEDVRRAEDISGGKPTAKVRGGTHQRTQIQAVIQPTARPAPTPVWMEIDIMFVQGLSFLVCQLLPIGYVMGAWLKNKTVGELGEAITLATGEASAHNLDVQLVKSDGEKGVAAYAPELKKNGIDVQCVPGEKCGTVERTIETLKEFCRAMCNGGVPMRLCKMLVVMCVLFIASRVNVLPTKSSMDGRSAYEKYFQRPFDCKIDGSWGFGDYCEATKIATNNSMASRTEACIMGVPTHSLSGSVLMYKIATGTMVTRRQWQLRPYPDYVIEELNARADEDNLAGGDQWGDEGQWDYYAMDNGQAAVIDALPPPLDVPLPGQQALVDAGVDLPEGLVGAGGDDMPQQFHAEDNYLEPAGAAVDGTHAPALRRSRRGGGDSLLSLKDPRTVLTSSNNYGAPNRRIRRLIEKNKDFCFKISVRAALRDREQEARISITAELQQLIDKGVWHGVFIRDLTEQQRREIIRSCMFLKDKYTAQNVFEKFKARLVAGGDQQKHSLYEDVSSPTVRTESVLTVAAIAAAENRKVMIIDIGGAFLNVDIAPTGVKVFVRLDKVMTKFLLELDPSYAKFVNSDGTCVVQLDKALYGTLEAAKLWFDAITAKFREDGFEANPYDVCVMNKMTPSGVQITTTFHVDDLMVTCEDDSALDAVAAMLRRTYPEVTERRGDVLDYLAMTFDFRTSGEVKVTMKKLVDDILSGSGVTAERKTPATEELFEVRDAEKLSEERRDYFRSYVAKLLYVAKRVRPEMLAAVSFLTTRAQSPDVDDLGKLQRVLGYLLGTRERGIVLRIGDYMTVGAYIDAAYGVHSSSGKSHSGCAMVLGHAALVHVKSTKQKIVTKSSTESELVALSDYASQGLSSRNFVIAQGYDVGPVVLHQDNTSCMALMKRGGPASERSRHIDIRYFWVKERVDGREAVVRHLATEKMFVNVMTKPVQGQQFINERDMLTNWH